MAGSSPTPPARAGLNGAHHRFHDLLAQGPLVCDGAMGTQIFSRLEPSAHWRCLDALSVGDPEEQELVKRIHLSYIEAGAQIIETNSFGANRVALASFGHDTNVERINSNAAKIARLAREASGQPVLIAGSMGPMGQPFEVWRAMGHKTVVDVFREQAAALDSRGVDLFIIETFSDLDELVLAIEGVRAASSLPIVAQMTFTEEGVTRTGITPARMVDRLAGMDVTVLGANCSTGPSAMLNVIEEMVAAVRPGTFLSVQPNVGESQRRGSRVYYPASSTDYFADFGRQAVAAGARLIGGCCGTTPSHIAALARAIRENEPNSGVSLSIRSREAEEPLPLHQDEPTRLQRLLDARKFVVSVELDPPNGVHLDGLLETCRVLQESGLVDVVDINDRAKVSMNALLFSRAVERDLGMETIPHLTCRDHTAAGLKATLLGSYAVLGIRNVLAITGDPPGVAGYPERQGVYEVDSIGLVRLMSRLNQGLDLTGKQIGGNTQFYIGVAVNPTAADLSYEIDRFHQKIEAGARFAMTQAVFSPEQWDLFLERLGPSPIPILVGVWPLPSHQLARYVANEVPGCVIPDHVMKALQEAGPNARSVGFRLAAQVIREVRSSAAGVYIIAPHKKPEQALELLSGEYAAVN